MKIFKVAAITLTAGMLLLSTACSSFTNTGKGALIGGAGAGALGAGVGALIGGKDNRGKGAAIGAGVGAAVGAGFGALIGNKMDKQKKELEQQLAQSATVEQTTDGNGLQAIKVTFNGGILFPTNGTTLSTSAKNELAQFATSLLQNPQTDVTIEGFTDNTGSMSANEKVATGRANSVKTYLEQCGVPKSRLTALAFPMQSYIATNETAEGRALNRRVEIYITANEDMIKAAQDGTLK